MQIPEVYIGAALHFSELSAYVTGLKLPTEVGIRCHPHPPPRPNQAKTIHVGEMLSALRPGFLTGLL